MHEAVVVHNCKCLNVSVLFPCWLSLALTLCSQHIYIWLLLKHLSFLNWCINSWFMDHLNLRYLLIFYFALLFTKHLHNCVIYRFRELARTCLLYISPEYVKLYIHLEYGCKKYRIQYLPFYIIGLVSITPFY